MHEQKEIVMAEEALKYLRRGWSIIPVGAGEDGKSPFLKTWSEYQNRKPTEIEVKSWWEQWPNANIAVITGRISGISVVDVDCKHGDPTEPDKITDQGSTKGLPPTLTARSGSGGWHFYYKYPDGLSSRIGIAHLVDIKSDGGYIILPPSLHRSGNRYEWVLIEDLQPFPLGNFPDIYQNKYNNTDWATLIDGVPVGERNKAASQLIGKLLKNFKPDEWGSTVWPMAVFWNKGLADPLAETELRAVFNSITSRELRAMAREANPEDGEDEVLPISSVVQMLQDDNTLSYPTGYPKIDDALNGGMREGDLIVVTGKSGFGKTSLSQAISYRLASNKIPCLWFSYEVLLKELWGKFTGMGAMDDLMTYTPIKNVSGRIDWITKKIVEAKEKYKIKAVFIDHLGFLAPSFENKSVASNYSLYLGAVCRELKKVAVDENIIVVLMVHLRKSNNEDPNMDDIGHSAAISQESDAILLINRKLASSPDENGNIYRDTSKLKILKNRRTGMAIEIDIKMRNGILTSLEEAEVIQEKAADAQVAEAESQKRKTQELLNLEKQKVDKEWKSW
jgi:energy-coupling factor transporter ATP-binding protein EcfA2